MRTSYLKAILGNKLTRKLHIKRLYMRSLRGKWKQNINKVFGKKQLVDFIICGTQKGGTTALYSYLKEHPYICMSEKKEIHFFDNESIFKNGKPNYAEYHSFFSPRPEHKVVGEATPIYMYWYHAPRRIWEYNPEIKLIVLLRNPITRAYSHWNMERMNKTENLSFWDAIQEEERRKEALPNQHRFFSYIDRGFYLEQLRRLWHFFPKENILILKSERLRDNPKEVLSEICHFLGVEDFEKVEPKEVHKRSYKSRMSNKEKEYLLSIFEYEIKNLERVLGWDCSDWLS